MSMFTAKHYKAIEGVIRERRRAARTELEHRIINEFQFALMNMFKDDTLQFNELRFVGGCAVG